MYSNYHAPDHLAAEQQPIADQLDDPTASDGHDATANVSTLHPDPSECQ